MKNKVKISLLSLLVLVCVVLLPGCSDDPESTNEEESITTVVVTLTRAGGAPIVLTWDDANLDAIVDDTEITTSGSLLSNKTYNANIQLENKTAGTPIDEEVRDEADDHLFCFTATNVNIGFEYADEDSHGRPLGLVSTWTTTSASEGTVTIVLRHQPGVKTGDCPGAGETDVSITFNVEIENPE
jgi:hypothetical protein